MKEFFEVIAAIVGLLALAYLIPRMASIAIYRTRAEYRRLIERKHGERDAKKRP